MTKKTANAVWNGTLTKGNGHLKSQSGKLDADYTWKSRSGEGPDTNPEELIAAAHAGCFSMALAGGLEKAGMTPTRIRTDATVTFDEVQGGFAITGIQLRCEAEVPGIDEAAFRKHAEGAKAGCPVSKALASVPITLEATLKGAAGR
jgi:osmotically inducible protein OsmC